MELEQACAELNRCMDEQNVYVGWGVLFGWEPDPLLPVMWELLKNG